MRALLAAGGLPLPDAAIDDAVNQVVVPRPLGSDVKQAKRELEADGFIHGSRDDLDESLMTWSLTSKGTHRAECQ